MRCARSASSRVSPNTPRARAWRRFGDTHVLCTATVEERVPPFLRNTGKGWVTAEYGMLPRSTHTRTDREAARGRQSGRTQEIQRLIGRSLRAVTDLVALGERQIRIDCDVLQADGGTRTAADHRQLCRAAPGVARNCVAAGLLPSVPLNDSVAAISCGVVATALPVLDLDYAEDLQAMTDANFVLTGGGRHRRDPGDRRRRAVRRGAVRARCCALARAGIAELTAQQRAALGPRLTMMRRGSTRRAGWSSPATTRARSRRSRRCWRRWRRDRRAPPRSACRSRRRPATASRPTRR